MVHVYKAYGRANMDLVGSLGKSFAQSDLDETVSLLQIHPFCAPIALCGKGRREMYHSHKIVPLCGNMQLMLTDSPLFSHLLCGCGQNQDPL